MKITSFRGKTAMLSTEIMVKNEHLWNVGPRQGTVPCPTKPLSYAKLYELFLQTLDHCGLFLLNEDTDSIEWHLFEEFDSGSITFLHENTLDCLLDGGNITAEVYSLCQSLRKKFRDLEETSLWQVEAVCLTREWYEILSLADKIKTMVNRKDYKAGGEDV